jgi:glycosyltransferase involved in cell wall biosynthesis
LIPTKVINKEMTSDIKVVISDNNSTDIEGYKNIEKYCTDNNLTYNRNATNLFSDTNIVSGFLHADKCNYLWILSDDDMLMEGSISTIMDILVELLSLITTLISLVISLLITFN